MSLAGKVVGPYTLGERIAEGRSSVVYAASALPKRREAAVKILKPSFAADRALAARYVRACNLAELRDARVFVQVVEAGLAEDGVPWVAMELSHGRTLAASLIEEGSRSAARAAATVSAVAEGLFALHKKGRAYGGLEPRKIMIEGFGEAERARLLEAELSDLMPDLRPDAAYVAPERIPGAPASPAADVYALGVLLRALIDRGDSSGLSKLADEWCAADPALRPVHAGHVLAALEKLGFAAAISQRPVKSDSSRPARVDSKRPGRADSLRPESSRPAPVPRANSAVPRVKSRSSWPVLALIVVVAIAGGAEILRRTMAAKPPPQKTVQIPREPIVVIAEPEIEEPPPLVAPEIIVAPSKPVEAAAPRPAAAVAPAAPNTEALFVELDAQLGKALESRGLVWDDLVRVEPERTKRWGRWYRKSEAASEADLRAYYSALDRAIERAERQARTSTTGG